MRSVLLVLALLPALAACGGPSRAQIEAAIREAEEEAAAEQEAENEGPPPSELALGILRDCALADVGRLLGLLDVFRPLVDENAPYPPFELERVDPATASIHWRLDTTGDGLTDMLGSFRFEGPNGEMLVPFTPAQIESFTIAGDLSPLPALLDELPPGATLVMQFQQTGSVEVVGLMGVGFDTGAPVLGGTVNILAVGCTTSFRIRALDGAAMAGEFPLLDVPMTVSAANGVLVGSVRLDGTPMAVIRVVFDETPLEFHLDLATGIVTEPV